MTICGCDMTQCTNAQCMADFASAVLLPYVVSDARRFSALGRNHARASQKSGFGSMMAEGVYTKWHSLPQEKCHPVSQPIWKMIQPSNPIVREHGFFLSLVPERQNLDKLFQVVNHCNCYVQEIPT